MNKMTPLKAAAPLSRMAIMLTEHCNIACPYCYEHRDPEVFYHPDPKKRTMSESSALDLLERVYRVWPSIGTLFFFGGEPLLKRDIIERICKAIDANEIPGVETRPRFAMITNAVLLEEEARKLVTSYNFELNISLDGPPLVNDMTRITRKGRGTSSKSMENLRRLRDMGGSYHIEATYSKFHIKAGVSVPDLMDYFYDEHNIGVLHAPWVSSSADDSYHLTDDEIVESYTAAIDYSLENLRKGIPKVIFLVDQWLKVLKSYDPSSTRPYCPAFFSDLSINPAGDVYPCFMFNGFQHLKMGSVYDQDFLRSMNWSVGRAFQHSIFGPCDCPKEYQVFHSGCVGADRIATNSILAKPYCGVHTRLLEAFLERLSEQSQIPLLQCAV
ncbi:radical SAM protein with 4Fe4S-binding SPASM domain [Bradyrhizobium sp. GM5.1]